MKIAHIIRRFTFREWGGTESVVWNIALQQKAQGLTPEIICTAALDKIGCEVVDFWGEPLEFDGDVLSLYRKSVEHLEAKDDIILIAEKEGLTAHANAIKVRFE